MILIKPSLVSMGIYTSVCPLSLKAESWDEGGYNWLFLFSSPHPSAGEGVNNID